MHTYLDVLVNMNAACFFILFFQYFYALLHFKIVFPSFDKGIEFFFQLLHIELSLIVFKHLFFKLKFIFILYSICD